MKFFFCVELEMYSAKSYTKVVVRDLPNSSKIGRFCAEYIFFHGNTMKRIPYDTEIIYFLKHWLHIEKSSFPKTLEHNFETLVTRIHDCCCLVIHGIKLRKNNLPGRNKGWTRQLKREEREYLDDPGLILTPHKKRRRTIPIKSPLHKQSEDTKSLKPPLDSGIESKPSPEKELDFIPIDLSKTEIKQKETITEPKKPFLSCPIPSQNKNTPSKSSNSSTVADNTNAGSSTSKEKEYVPAFLAPTEWAQNRTLLKELGLFPSESTRIPKSWTSKKGASNPQAALIPDISKNIITKSMQDLDKICLTDLEYRLDEENLEEEECRDYHLIDDIENEISELKAGRSVMYSSCKITLECDTFKRFLRELFHRNILWDLGFQMTHLMSNKNNLKYRNIQLSTQCFCPCANYFQAWRQKLNLNVIFCKEVHRCKGRGVYNSTSSFLQHCADLSDSCLVHRSMLSYLRHLYPAQTQNMMVPSKNKKKSSTLNFGKQKSKKVSVPRSVMLTSFKINTFSITR